MRPTEMTMHVGFDCECLAKPGHLHNVPAATTIPDVINLEGWLVGHCTQCNVVVFRGDWNQEGFGRLMYIIPEPP